MTVDKAKQFLREEGYFTDNLWHVNDVKSLLNNEEINDETCQQILDNVMTNEWLVQNIFEMIGQPEIHGVNIDDS